MTSITYVHVLRAFVLTFSASSSSTTFAVESTRTLDPNIYTHNMNTCTTHVTCTCTVYMYMYMCIQVHVHCKTCDKSPFLIIIIIISCMHQYYASCIKCTCTQCMYTCPCLNLVNVHSCVCYQDLGILDPLWLINTYLLLKQEA